MILKFVKLVKLHFVFERTFEKIVFKDIKIKVIVL